jgi:hypothetical protein
MGDFAEKKLPTIDLARDALLWSGSPNICYVRASQTNCRPVCWDVASRTILIGTFK